MKSNESTERKIGQKKAVNFSSNVEDSRTIANTTESEVSSGQVNENLQEVEINYEARKSASDRAGVKFPISRLAKFAKKGKYADRVGQGVPVFMAGVLEYLTFELLELASNKAGENKRSKSIMPRHIMLAIKSDAEFNKFLKGAEFHSTGRMPTYLADMKSNKKKKSQDEDEEEEDNEFEVNEADVDDDDEMVFN